MTVHPAFLAPLSLRPTSRKSVQVSPIRWQRRCTPVCTAAASNLPDVLAALPEEYHPKLQTLPEDVQIAPLGLRHTKIAATIGPATSSPTELLRLCAEGMNIARLNLCHGDYEWHRDVIRNIRDIVLKSPFVTAIMMDLGSYDTVRIGEFAKKTTLEPDGSFTFTIRHEPSYPPGVSEVSDDDFIDAVKAGDFLQCQAEGGDVVEFLVTDVQESDVICKVVSGGELKSRGMISMRGKSLNLNPANSDDLNISIAQSVLGCPPEQLEFAIEQRVEYVALSFVESPDQIRAVRRELRKRSALIGIIAKIESPDALRNLDAIVSAADGVMIARGDLGTAIDYAKVPYWQLKIAETCRAYGKPCLISTHFLESMVLYPTPTRAEVTDMTEAVKQRVDALVLTAETASGKFPFKAISTMNSVLMRMQRRIHELEAEEIDSISNISDIPPLGKDSTWWNTGVGKIAENIASTAAEIATQQSAKAILVFTQKGLMATLTCRYRPQAPIFAFTATPVVRNKLNLLYGVRPFIIEFEDDPEETILNAITILKERRAVEKGDLVVILADVLGGRKTAPLTEVKSVFEDVAKGKRTINADQVRNALRVLGLKASDRLETKLGMSDVDIADFKRESNEKKKVVPQDDSLNKALGKYDFDRFLGFASEAQEIVHTLQLRTIV